MTALYRSPDGRTVVTQHGSVYELRRGTGPPEHFRDYWTAISAARRAAGYPIFRADGAKEARK